MSLNTKKIYNIDWIIPRLRNPRRLWRIASTITMVAVGIFSKIIIQWFNKTRIHNREILTSLLSKRPIPLITVSNHHSCFDDPGLWGTLKWKHIMTPSRWSLAAHDICFTCNQHAYFFTLGRCIPIIRGAGVYQKAVDFCIEQLAKGSWIHIFPEGKVNITKENMRLKWGIGRLIYEAPITPIVVPIWHIGMDDVLPNDPPYILRTGKKLTFNYGKPLDLKDMVNKLKERQATDIEARKEITDYIQQELLKLRIETEQLHNDYFNTQIS